MRTAMGHQVPRHIGRRVCPSILTGGRVCPSTLRGIKRQLSRKSQLKFDLPKSHTPFRRTVPSNLPAQGPWRGRMRTGGGCK